jgi:flagellar hook assembly protein FlgD
MGYFRKGPKTIIVPGQTSLNQNYPNPFNPSTTIEYDLGFGDGPSQRVNLNIYDILGRTVKTLLFNEDQTIGRYQIRWDGKDENNIPVSSGVYFVYLQTNKGRTYTKKIMLMR